MTPQPNSNAGEKKTPLKRCTTCDKRKPHAEFSRDSSRWDGRMSRCKVCDRKCNSKKKKESGFYHSEKYKKKTARYRLTDKYKKAIRKSSLKNADHIFARRAVHKAIRKGELKKRGCQSCGELKVQAHHYLGYAPENWLDVIWLCQPHHSQAHYG